MLVNRLSLPRIATVVIAGAVIGVSAPAMATAAPASPPVSAQSIAQYSDAQLDAAAANIAAGFDRIRSRLSPELENKPLNSPEVQRALGSGVQPRSIFGCAFAVTQAALSIGVPVAKIYRIAKEFGGLSDFIKIVFNFIRTGSFPASASEEAIDLILALSGVGGIISSCL